MIGSSDITQVGMLLGACATLGTVIGVLWKQMIAHFHSVDEKLDNTQKALSECQDDRLKIWQTLAQQAGRSVDELRDRSGE